MRKKRRCEASDLILCNCAPGRLATNLMSDPGSDFGTDIILLTQQSCEVLRKGG